MWLTPICISYPSSVMANGHIITSALLTRMCRAPSFLNEFAKRFTDLSEPKSSERHSTGHALVVTVSPALRASDASWSQMLSTAARPRVSERAAMMTRQPFFASASAVSKPTPAWPPVTTAVLPSSGGMSSCVNAGWLSCFSKKLPSTLSASRTATMPSTPRLRGSGRKGMSAPKARKRSIGLSTADVAILLAGLDEDHAAAHRAR
mmetsp:Transcript_10427/g.30971  ORF Transcript_10427/g.30971 Transcript_10427/m.30971 type:complete len:206 (+) Transcript_10427:2234-2851(+)